MNIQDLTPSPNDKSQEMGQEGQPPGSTSRRNVMAGVGLLGTAFVALNSKAWAQQPVRGSFSNEALALPDKLHSSDTEEEVRAVKIARAMRAGPPPITKDATVAEMDRHGNVVTTLRQGTNDWICTPGDENRIGDPPMCIDRIGMQWFKDIVLRKPRPSNTTPGLCYMLCGATQHSNTDGSTPPVPRSLSGRTGWCYGLSTPRTVVFRPTYATLERGSCSQEHHTRACIFAARPGPARSILPKASRYGRCST